MTTTTRWSIEYPSNSLLTAEQKSQIDAVFNNPEIQNRETRDEIKQVILKLTGIPFLTPSYIIRDLSK